MRNNDELTPTAFYSIHNAFVSGDGERLRELAADYPGQFPNVLFPLVIGQCLVYAIYHSPLSFIRELLELGADPNVETDDGFPTLIAALSCLQAVAGARRREDVNEIVELLLQHGADPNQRGINDYTPLHHAVSLGSVVIVRMLLRAGADPNVRTRIDEYETAQELARRTGKSECASAISEARERK